MQKIIIDKEFQYLLPELDEITYRGLEDGILMFGCLTPLILWNNILIDGHHRYKICMEHNIPYETKDMEFNTREAVMIWIIDNQKSRRNLTPMQLSYFRGINYKAEKRIVKIDKETSENDEKGKNYPSKPGNTANRLAEKYKVSPKTIKSDKSSLTL